MAIHILKPTQIVSAGNKPKIIKEYIGRVNSKTEQTSIAHMKSPGGWYEPAQTPEFDEYTLVLNGMLRVETKSKTFDVKAGEAIICKVNEWVKYSTPSELGAEYIAVCLPAFSINSVNREG
ncbi:MAG: cupin domain-containing protein [Bacteroidia bacterium]